MRSALSALLLWLAVGLWPALGVAQTLIVLNKSDNTATFLDGQTGEALATLPTGHEPHEVAVSPDGRRAIGTDYGSREVPGHTLTLFDVGTQASRTLSLGAYTRPHGVVWLDDARVAVTAEGAQALVILDVDREVVEAAIRTDRRVSHMVAVTPDGRRAFVPDLGSGTVAVIDLETNRLVTHLETGAGAEGVAVSPNGAEVWVSNRADDTVSIVDARTLELLDTLPTGSFPIRVAISPDGRRALVSNARSSDVSVFDAETRAELARVRLDAPLADDGAEGRYFASEFEGSVIPIGLAFSPDGSRAFVAASNADVIVVISMETLRPIARWATGRQPDGLAVAP